jgi:ABC-2 type transport system ATP-binding protein
MITIESVSKTYGASFKAVDDLTLAVEPGGVHGFLGPNGAGKSTTIKMITGVLPADAGRISVGGYDIETDDIAAKMSIGFVPDAADAFLNLTGVEYLNFMADMYEVPQGIRRTRIGQLAPLMGIDDALDDKILSYSHGMRGKLVIVGSLLHDPAVWILDEPQSGLDPKSARALKDLMRERASAGNVVFFSSHVLDVVEDVCDQVSVLSKGRLLYSGDLSGMKVSADASLESVFLEMTDEE